MTSILAIHCNDTESLSVLFDVTIIVRQMHRRYSTALRKNKALEIYKGWIKHADINTFSSKLLISM